MHLLKRIETNYTISQSSTALKIPSISFSYILFDYTWQILLLSIILLICLLQFSARLSWASKGYFYKTFKLTFYESVGLLEEETITATGCLGCSYSAKLARLASCDSYYFLDCSSSVYSSVPFSVSEANFELGRY